MSVKCANPSCDKPAQKIYKDQKLCFICCQFAVSDNYILTAKSIKEQAEQKEERQRIMEGML